MLVARSFYWYALDMDGATERATFRVAVNVFVIQDGKFLLGKRKAPYHDGEWGLPGGHLEKGEKAVNAGMRELEEETGLTAKRLEFVCCDNDIRDDGNQYVHFAFAAHEVAGTLTLREPNKCYEWGWFPLEALPSPLFIGHRKIIRAFIEKVPFIE